MAGILKLFCDDRRKQLYASDVSKDIFVLPNLIQGQQTIEFTLMEENPMGLFEQAPWTKISPQTYSLKVGVYNASTGAQLAFQNVWTDDTTNSKKVGCLSLNTAAIVAALVGVPSVPCIWETSTVNSQGEEEVVYQAPATLKKAYGIFSLAIPADVTVATQDWVKSTFVKLEEDDGQRIILRNSAGTFAVEIGVDVNGSVYMNKINL